MKDASFFRRGERRAGLAQIPGQGTGMGLAAVHGIVKACGGAVTVRSAPGRGSVFVVFFPLAGDGAASGREA